MTQFSLANLFGVTIRESANDGSDFTNPDADYRRLFLGEDGLLHVKDSAGAVTSPYSGGSIVKLGTLIKRTAGSITCNQTTWGELAAETGGPGTGGFDFDFTGVLAGDVAEVTMSGLWASEAVDTFLDVATIVSAAPVNYFSAVTPPSTGQGVMAWYGPASSRAFGGSAFYVIQSGDLSAGALKLRPYMATFSAANKTLYAVTDNPLMIMAKVYRP